jgi:eukaryotic-like serine/threonine-protein kinase
MFGTDRFLAEIEIASHLTHPHILALHDSGELHGLPFYVMPLVQGESLRDRLKGRQAMPLAECLSIAHDVADALDYAHRAGVVHRDIKPENVLIAEGHAVVADFGIASAARQPTPSEAVPVEPIAGTPAYMSPEQATGGKVDGRSDVYGLGSVLYEMLTGEQLFRGATIESVLRRQAFSEPPALDVRRLPAGVCALVARALAKRPDDRFPTAAAFAEAVELELAKVAVRGRSRTRRLPRAAHLSLALGALLALVMLTRAATRRDPAALSQQNVIAVAPFEVLDPALDLWREGLVDLLARDFDGAGPLRAIAPSVAIRAWRGRVEHAEALRFGEATDAGLVVYGTLLPAGDSVRARVTVLNVGTRRPVAEFERRESALRVDRLADSIAVAVLAEVGRTRPLGATRSRSFQTTALPALREFLRAEQFVRRAEWDSAAVHYERALTLDSTLAVAHARLAESTGWREPPDWRRVAYVQISRAQPWLGSVAPRESLLIASKTLWLRRENATVQDSVRAVAAAMIGVGREFTRRYPEDPEAWSELAEAVAHDAGWTGRVAEDEALRYYDRAIGLDSGFAPAYFHATEIAAKLQGAAGALRYVRAYPSNWARDRAAPFFRTAAELLDPASSRLADVRRIGATSDPATLGFLLSVFGRLSDSAETGAHLARAVLAHVDAQGDEAFFFSTVVPLAMASRGHLAEAYAAALRFPRPDERVLAQLASLGAVSDESASALFTEILGRRSLLGTADRGLLWWARRRDATSLRGHVRRADSVSRAATGPSERHAATFERDAARAMLDLVAGDTSAALRRLTALDQPQCPNCNLRQLTLAQVFSATRSDSAAWGILSKPFGFIAHGTGEPEHVLWELMRARVAERLGERAIALAAYDFVANAWQNADAVLAPQVREAREGAARLR